MTEPTAGMFDRKPIAATSIQFNGTVLGLVGVFQVVAGDTDGVFMTISFGPNGTIREVRMTGKTNLVINNRDWVIVPDDGTSMFVVSNEEYVLHWISNEPTPAPAPSGE